MPSLALYQQGENIVYSEERCDKKNTGRAIKY